ncbi:class F sortase [Yinghuangia seranimata]|uniref:class F sortase n=1 Tax=Yinghuangia seranimata TaxID=408067 RepID=UPI00248CDA40|nr:class F sortase [Yinghuangia seranimata]MDI2128999.1 class F sortase [Yinghuangia seranimata]
MSQPEATRMGRGKLVAIAAGAVFLGVTVINNHIETENGPPQPAAAAQSAAPAPAGSAPGAAGQARPQALGSSPPVRIRIARIGVDAPFVGLGLNSSGVIDVPPATDRNLAGWYKDGVTPGARGAAIVLGHVDTMAGPAVFWNLGSLKQGDEVVIDRVDGKSAKFAVDSVEVFQKDAFPDDRVYGQTSDAQLRLITCGGGYDKKRKDYLGNVVVFAHFVPGG